MGFYLAQLTFQRICRAAILNLDPKCWSELLDKKHFHLIGICGTAMALLAGMLVAQGHEVTGSDENVYPPMSTELERMGIPISAAYRPENVSRRPDIVVVGNAITRGNPELEFVLNEKIPYTSM